MTKSTTKPTSTNKEALITSVAEFSGLSKAKATQALEAILQSIQKELKKENNVTLVGFGSFSVQKREAREGRNPRTGASIKIAASKAIKFKAGKKFKEEIA